ncbi:hypothetical protein SDC9_208865 [bioreactor metagenome]|uniref:Uncharacterized protein n=1 Tax=bioreactor metagenome TaxID=1076179 RepID=A0A645JBU8_9ZZZZ
MLLKLGEELPRQQQRRVSAPMPSVVHDDKIVLLLGMEPKPAACIIHHQMDPRVLQRIGLGRIVLGQCRVAWVDFDDIQGFDTFELAHQGQPATYGQADHQHLLGLGLQNIGDQHAVQAVGV